MELIKFPQYVHKLRGCIQKAVCLEVRRRGKRVRVRVRWGGGGGGGGGRFMFKPIGAEQR